MFPVHSWKPDETGGTFQKRRAVERALASGDGDVDLFSAPSSLGARSIDVACLPCPTSQTRHKDQVKITQGCSNPLKAVTPRDFYLRAKRKQNCGEKLRKYHLYLNAKAHLTFSSCSLSCMTKHPSLPGLFPVYHWKPHSLGNSSVPGWPGQLVTYSCPFLWSKPSVSVQVPS